VTPETEGLIIRLRERLRERPDLHLAVLFGSQARGKARPDSDLDLAVLGDQLDTLSLARDLSLATDLEVDVIDLGQDLGYPLLNAIVRDAIFVFQGRPNAGGRWLSNSLLQLELDRPWYERMRNAYLKGLAEGAHG
jgi:predicted nucleotidyltransferase